VGQLREAVSAGRPRGAAAARRGEGGSPGEGRRGRLERRRARGAARAAEAERRRLEAALRHAARAGGRRGLWKKAEGI